MPDIRGRNEPVTTEQLTAIETAIAFNADARKQYARLLMELFELRGIVTRQDDAIAELERRLSRGVTEVLSDD
jgi:hypothetical protein